MAQSSASSSHGNGLVRLAEHANALRPDPALILEGKAAIPDDLTFDRALSWRARGIADFLYTYPPGWSCRVADLCEPGTHGMGRDAIMAGLKELVEHGWIEPLYVKGRIPPELRMAVLCRDGFRCVICDTGEDLTADHVIPERHGGATTFGNLQTMCRPCNSQKGARG